MLAHHEIMQRGVIMDRRTFLAGSLAAVAAGSGRAAQAAGEEAASRWAPLERQLGDRLIDVRSPLVAAARGETDAGALMRQLKNPYYLGDDPALTQTLGWTEAWTSQPSLKAVAARSAGDVSAAVRFARDADVPLVVKGGGHSYFGNSNRAGSLLVWTRRLRDVQLHDAFRATNSPADAAPVPAVSVGAGCIWGEVYRAAARQGRYVQGGGCLTVGVTGFTMGGGFGSLSKQFGTGAANLIEAEIVTADGTARIVNAHSHPDLFYALRGGGGGTFGIATRLTMRTHDLPERFGGVIFDVTANSEPAWRALVGRVVDFYASDLFNPHWGEQIRFSGGRRLGVSMVCHGLEEAKMRQVWEPLLGFLRSRPADYAFAGEPLLAEIPGRSFWEPEFLRQVPGLVLGDDRPGAPRENIFWASNLGEAAQTLHAYQSAWLPADLLSPARRGALVDALIAGAAEWSVALHMNKGLAGGTAEAIAATRETATNPAVLDAFALLICAADGPPAWPGIAGHTPDVALARREAERVARAMAPFRKLVPNAGAYMSEADYHQPGWQDAYWGRNYARLAAIKRRYDPDNLFKGHHCVTPA